MYPKIHPFMTCLWSVTDFPLGSKVVCHPFICAPIFIPYQLCFRRVICNKGFFVPDNFTGLANFGACKSQKCFSARCPRIPGLLEPPFQERWEIRLCWFPSSFSTYWPLTFKSLCALPMHWPACRCVSQFVILYPTGHVSTSSTTSISRMAKISAYMNKGSINKSSVSVLNGKNKYDAAC